MSYNINKHYKRARTISLVLLFFLGISALGGAVGMILDPTGKQMQLPQEMLAHTPFDNFLLPAIILGVFNGILSLLFAILVIKKHRLQSWMVIFQGGVLTVWLTAEILMDLYFPPLTLPYLLVATMLLTCGVLMKLSKTGLS